MPPEAPRPKENKMLRRTLLTLAASAATTLALGTVTGAQEVGAPAAAIPVPSSSGYATVDGVEVS